MLQVGTKAPDFLLKDKDDNDIRLSDYLGKKVVVYFIHETILPGVPDKPALLQKLMMDLKKRIL